MVFRRIIVTLFIVCLTVNPYLFAQNDTVPEPYTEEEFGDELAALRRFEVIAFGSFPVVLLLTNIIADTTRFVDRSIEIGEVNTTYLPLFFAPPGKPDFTDEENAAILLTTIAISLGFALIDLIINLADPLPISQGSQLLREQ